MLATVIDQAAQAALTLLQAALRAEATQRTILRGQPPALEITRMDKIYLEHCRGIAAFGLAAFRFAHGRLAKVAPV